jgi:hypothetical protein
MGHDSHSAGGVRPRSGGRRWAAVAVAVGTLVVVAISLLDGLGAAERERQHAAAGAAAMPRDQAGYHVFQAPGVPEQFVAFLLDRVGPTDTVEYVVAGVNSCQPTGRVFGRMLWLQFRLAPRPTVCEAQWRIYVATEPPLGVAASDKFSSTMAAVRLR